MMEEDMETAEPQPTESQADILTDLVERGKTAADDGQLEVAERMALQAMVGARGAKDSYLSGRSPYTKQQLAHWFGTCAYTLNSTGKYMNAARCFYTATVFDDNWTEEEHSRVAGVLWQNIYSVKTDQFRNDFRSFLAFLHELEEIAVLAEQLKRWEVSIRVSLDTVGSLGDIITLHRVGVKDRGKQKIIREALMRIARCGLGLENHRLVRQFCHRVLQDFSDYNDPEAFEVWGRSLVKEKDYLTAQKKVTLALKYAKNQADCDRLEQLLLEISRNIETPIETDQPDPEWLTGTGADEHKKMTVQMKSGIKEKEKKKHKRPKARERSQDVLLQTGSSPGLPPEEEAVLLYARNTEKRKSESPFPEAHDKNHAADKIASAVRTPSRQEQKKRRHASSESRSRHESYSSDISSFLVQLSDFDSDSDSSENSISQDSDVSAASSALALLEIEESSEESTATFYELSCRFHGDTGEEDNSEAPKDIKLLREGLQLNSSFIHSVKCNHKKERNFYEEMLSPAECEQRLKRQPKMFKRCSLQIEGSHISYCTPIRSDGKISSIEISGRSKAGRTFNEDEVVVQVLDVAHEDKDKRYGKVVGILQRERHKEVKHPVFVCTLDDMESHLVRPMCKTVPKIHILHNKILQKFYAQRKNKIELYDYDHRNGTLEFARIIDINPAEREKYVFLVAYLQWEKQQFSIYPVGAVIRMLPCGDSISSGLKILDLQHEVPSVYSAASVCRLESITRRQQDEPSESLTYGRQDLTHLDTFTIDPPGSKDIDDALSIEKLQDGFRVGVHISDVSMYVGKGDDIDKEAFERAVTFYPGVRNPRHMLPEPLSQNICSLVPMKKRLCISVFHDLDDEGGYKHTDIRLTVIKSRRQFTYAEAQDIINSPGSLSGPETTIPSSIKQLHRLAEKRRKMRLGNAMFALDLETDDCNEESSVETLEAHYLVEEFMILTNWKVAKHLVRAFPDTVPLRCQPPPSKESLDKFMKDEKDVLNLVLKLQDKKIHPAPSLETALRTSPHNQILIQKWLWDLISENPELAVRYMKMDEHFPLQYLAYQHWLSIQEHAFYKCSGSLTKEKTDGKHFSLDFANYTHFTSPIRRYIDLVIHRLVHCMLKKQKQRSVPYSTDEVEKICLHVNSVAKKAKAYEKGCKTLQMSIALRTTPQMKVCYVDEVSDKGVSLCSPDLKFVSKIYRELPFNLLDMGFKPEELTDTSTDKAVIRAKWRKRLYDFTGVPSVSSGSRRDTLRLNRHPGMVLLPAWDWAKLLKSGIDRRWKDFQTNAQSARCILPDSGLVDVNTEMYDISRLQPSTTFSLSFTRGQSLNIQMTAEAQKGLLAPKPQLFDVTKSFKCCLQHTDDPVMHLTRYSTKNTIDQYRSVQQYLERWLPLVNMEAAVGSVSSEDTCTINNVPVKFRGRSGKFVLPLSFCEVRNIDFGGIVDEGEDESTSGKSYDFLCIRRIASRESTIQSNVWIGHGEITKVLRKKNTEDTRTYSHRNGQVVSEAVHRETDDGKIVVSFDLHRLAPNPPIELADSNGLLSCGVEILIKSEVDRRTECFLKGFLEADSSLAERIALNSSSVPELGSVCKRFFYLSRPLTSSIPRGWSGSAKLSCILRYRGVQLILAYSWARPAILVADREHSRIAELMDRDLVIPEEGERRPLPRNNLRQQEAIDKALGSRFSLIQGPPGTGKTYTGIKLLYLFNEINKIWYREGNEQKQVLFCGPSNKSVDLVARWMIQRLGELCPNIVRVYGRSIEAVDFPIPGRSFLSKRSTHNAKADDELQSVALHHLIRQKGKPYAEEINSFDKQFKQTNYAPDIKKVRRYLRVIREASIAEIKEHEVILCTTAVASNPKLRDGSSIFQVIIDESGMCPEPQCMVPIIANKAEQVVLIGDHKQLRPIIMCKEAAELGLEKSLFEKYWESKSARSVQKTMLDTQYRMNPQLCRFPSDTFYQGKLKTESGLWMEGRVLKIWAKEGITHYPHIMVHIEGEEKVLTVSTEDGNEQSKSNEAELDHVVTVFRYLINDEQIPANQVNVISQYNAQCAEIRRRLGAEGFVNFKVNTVVSSQGGEWDYVIFSTVRSLPEYKIEENPTLGWCRQNLGFITDQNQINVALTRARKGLIIIGNKNLLRCDKVWGKLLKHYEERGCIKSTQEFPPKKSRQERMRTAFQMSEQRYGDERFIPGALPELGPYMAGDAEADSGRSGRSRFQRSNSHHGNVERRDVHEAGDGWQQQRRRKGRH